MLRSRWEQGDKDVLPAIWRACMDQPKFMAMDKDGCWLFQAVMEAEKDGDLQMALASKLAGSVLPACKSPHGNHVVQKIVRDCPSPSFVAEEIQGHACELAINQYGCRVLCRLLEWCPKEGPAADACDTLVREVLQRCVDLCSHKYGHHVIAAILGHGSNAQRRGVFEQLRKNPVELALKRHGSYIIEAALKSDLELNNLAVADTLASELLEGDPFRLSELAYDQFGSYVVCALLKMGGEHAKSAMGALQRDRSLLRKLECSKKGHLIRNHLESLRT